MKEENIILLTTLLGVILCVIALLVFVPMLCNFGSWGADIIFNFVSKLINIL